jgi:hypothetical protein
LGSDITVDPEESAFRRAMKLSVGTLLCLDETAKAFERIWCDYELFKTISSTKELHITANYGKPRLLTEMPLPGETLVAKSTRDRKFPATILGRGMCVKLQEGVASVQEDKKNILDSMGKDPTSGMVDSTIMERNVDLANGALGGFLAIAAWPNALKNQQVMSFPSGSVNEFLRLPDVLNADISRKRLVMSFAGMEEVDDYHLSLLAKGRPPNLESLTLCFESCFCITDAGLTKIMTAVSYLGLSFLHLDFSGCTKLTDTGVQAFVAYLPAETLIEVKVDFSLCAKISQKGVDHLARRLPTSLRKLTAKFKGTELNRNFETLHEFKRQHKSIIHTHTGSNEMTVSMSIGRTISSDARCTPSAI